MPYATKIHLIFWMLNNFNHFRYAINALDEGVDCRLAQLPGGRGVGGAVPEPRLGNPLAPRASARSRPRPVALPGSEPSPEPWRPTLPRGCTVPWLAARIDVL